jgi:hypothetical protein
MKLAFVINFPMGQAINMIEINPEDILFVMPMPPNELCDAARKRFGDCVEVITPFGRFIAIDQIFDDSKRLWTIPAARTKGVK